MCTSPSTPSQVLVTRYEVWPSQHSSPQHIATPPAHSGTVFWGILRPLSPTPKAVLSLSTFSRAAMMDAARAQSRRSVAVPVSGALLETRKLSNACEVRGEL